jgi:hypothetical protein
MRIVIDSAFYLNGDPDPDPDPGNQTNADPDPDPRQALKSVEFLLEKYSFSRQQVKKHTSEGTKAFL